MFAAPTLRNDVPAGTRNTENHLDSNLAFQYCFQLTPFVVMLIERFMKMRITLHFIIIIIIIVIIIIIICCCCCCFAVLLLMTILPLLRWSKVECHVTIVCVLFVFSVSFSRRVAGPGVLPGAHYDQTTTCYGVSVQLFPCLFM